MALVCWLLASGPVWPAKVFRTTVAHASLMCAFEPVKSTSSIGVIRPSNASAPKRMIGEPQVLEAEGNLEGSTFQSGGYLR